jgi:hypothetical protein
MVQGAGCRRVGVQACDGITGSVESVEQKFVRGSELVEVDKQKAGRRELKQALAAGQGDGGRKFG